MHINVVKCNKNVQQNIRFIDFLLEGKVVHEIDRCVCVWANLIIMEYLSDLFQLPYLVTFDKDYLSNIHFVHEKVESFSNIIFP